MTLPTFLRIHFVRFKGPFCRILNPFWGGRSPSHLQPSPVRELGAQKQMTDTPTVSAQHFFLVLLCIQWLGCCCCCCKAELVMVVMLILMYEQKNTCRNNTYPDAAQSYSKYGRGFPCELQHSSPTRGGSTRGLPGSLQNCHERFGGRTTWK